MIFEAFHITERGTSHIKKNRECQDASKSFCCEDYAIAVACDGHGGEDYIRSAVGSEIASQIAIDNIKEFISHVDKEYLKIHFDKLIRPLQSSIISMWQSEIRNHWDSNPITEEEKSRLSEKARKRYLVNNNISSAYGTTLLAAVVTKNYWFCFQVGDGRCVWIDKNSNFSQLKLDDKCFLNATTSLCDSDALEHFHNHYSEDIPAAVFVGSDGIDDCFQNDSQLYNFYKTISYSFGTTQIDQAVEELEDFLPRLSQKGSGDDVSIASVLNMDLLPNIDVVTSFNLDDERAKKQKAEEEEAKRNAELREEYQRNAEVIRKNLEKNRRNSEEELARQNALRIRQKAIDDEIKIAKVIKDLEIARRALADAKHNLETAEEVKNMYLQKLQNSTDDNNQLITQTDYKELCKVFQEKNDNYMKYVYEHQNALSKFTEAKIVHDSIIGRIGAVCPNPKCNKINLVSANFCSQCGTVMNTDSVNVQVQENIISEEEVVSLDDEKSCVKNFDELTANTVYDTTSEKLSSLSDRSVNQVISKNTNSISIDKETESKALDAVAVKLVVDEEKSVSAEGELLNKNLSND